jgi:hypothetical protein
MSERKNIQRRQFEVSAMLKEPLIRCINALEVLGIGLFKGCKFRFETFDFGRRFRQWMERTAK